MPTYKSNSSPIFIGGLYRSGTSLLRAMLGRHSSIAGGLETFWFNLDFAGSVKPGEETRNWDGTRNEPLKDHIIRLADFFEMEKAVVDQIAARSSGPEDFIDRFMARYASSAGKKRWVEKTPANVLHVERIFSFWPTGLFIYILRDPRDVYSSVRRTGKWAEPETFAKLWIKFVAAYESAGKSPFSNSVLELRYEDLVLDPFKTMRDVIDFIGEPWEESVALFDGEQTEFERVKKITGKSSLTLQQLSRPLAGNRVGAWKTELDDPKKLSEVEDLIHEAGFGDRWERYKYRDL